MTDIPELRCPACLKLILEGLSGAFTAIFTCTNKRCRTHFRMDRVDAAGPTMLSVSVAVTDGMAVAAR
jgi:hypothetical protein